MNKIKKWLNDFQKKSQTGFSLTENIIIIVISISVVSVGVLKLNSHTPIKQEENKELASYLKLLKESAIK